MLSERVYDPIRHLSNALFPFDQKNRVMVMVMDYTGYFDESENTLDKTRPNLPRVYTVAGCVGTDRQWLKFQKKWKAILGREVLPRWREVYGDNKPVFFHMTDFDNPHSKIYGDWPTARKVAFLRQLHNIMSAHSLRRFSSSTVVSDYEDLAPEEQYAMGNPHVHGAVSCFKLIRGWADKVKIYDRFLYVFESGSPHEKKLRRCTADLTDEQKDAYRISKIAFVDKREMSPLQGADILAFETRKEMCRQLDPGTRKTRQSIRNLHVPSLDEWAYMAKEQFRAILDSPANRRLIDHPEFKAKAMEAKKRGVL